MEQTLTLSIFPPCVCHCHCDKSYPGSSPRSATTATSPCNTHAHARTEQTTVLGLLLLLLFPFLWQPGPLAHSALSLLPECECIRGELGSVMSVVLCPCPLHVSVFIVCLFVESLALVGAVGGLPPAPPPRTILVNTQTPSRLR